MFLLCSDGLSNELGEDEMSNVLVHGNCQQASEVLVDMALDRGGRDNISVVVIRADNPCSVDTTVLNPALQA
jgi:protein phosphatase